MTSLLQLQETGEFEKTGAKPKLPIRLDGINDANLDVYRIPLDKLFYNDRNGRIATEMAHIDSKLKPVPDEIDTEYNDKIAEMIEKSSGKKLRKTQKSIQTDGQQVFGYVLNDGRIIDGNRRFTALRNLHKETKKTYYFEAVILPFSYEKKTDQIKIKELELALQMGVEARQDYDPVDLALDIYRTTQTEDAIMTLEDYVTSAKLKKKDAEDNVASVEYMHDFFAYIGAPHDKYSLIKETKTYSLFKEMAQRLNNKSAFSEDEDDQVKKKKTKKTWFALILYQIKAGYEGKKGTAAYGLRDYAEQIVKTDNNDNFNLETSDIVDDIEDTMHDENHIATAKDLVMALNKATPYFEKLGCKYNQRLRKGKEDKSVEALVKSIDNASSLLENLRLNCGLRENLHYDQFSKKQLESMQEKMRLLSAYSKDLFNIYGKEIKRLSRG